ncbi:THAP domain-containing protein 9 [Aphis craccivora]|uniref:THAP domain-containing protein 9 n=1 Tax=Aphis craccivora TaxID=307492 RepID=A0A6G0WFX7_APHCR|nr:THAP domain-containing protein 9 [Aphis craccivora]
MFKESKLKNSKNRRYSKAFINNENIIFLLSPTGYKFLRDQNILPLPCVSTIHKNLLAVKIGCGESLSVNSRSLTYIGLQDFGNEEQTKLWVFMWSSLTENRVQPIAVFASAGPELNIELSKLVVKAILLMEDAGAHVVGITCDGASTNRTKKQDFKNYIENPFDTSRKVFMFSDVPHVLKNIRNRLFQNKTLTVYPLKFSIKWEHYLNIFKIEGCSLTKVCPKLTKNHFELNNLAKMKVKYAAQIFSRSTAIGIHFYINKKINGFEDSKETINFTLIINDFFDSLNKKYTAEGRINLELIENYYQPLLAKLWGIVS